jgi:class 3 adenylate cyclase
MGPARPPGNPAPGHVGAAPAPGAQRKLVTVLLAEVDEAVEDFAERDPEDVGRMLAGHLARVEGEVRAAGGSVERVVGGRTAAVFGVPVAREDDPERAVRAALAIRDRLAGPGVRVNTAVATGQALVRPGQPGAGERQRVLGDLVTACARLLAAAPAGAVLVTETTRQASERAVAYRPAPPVALHGGPPEPVWQAVAPRPPGPDRPAVPLVGRDRELAVLLDLADQALAGRGPRLVTLVGGPGIGKSRLVAELAGRLGGRPGPVSWRHGRTPPPGSGPPLAALAEMVRAEAGITATDPEDSIEAKLAAAAPSAWVAGQLRRLVAASAAAGPPPEEAAAAWRGFLRGLAARGPLVLAFEDLHWADHVLLDLVERLADPAGLPLLVVATARPELLGRRPAWATGAELLRLQPLGDADTAELLAGLLAAWRLPPAAAGPELVGRVGGNPLFAEEYVRLLRDGGRIGQILPAGVHAIVAARLDALPADEKTLLHDLAVLGPAGWVGALAALGGQPPDRLQASLRQLVAREFLTRADRSRVAGEDEYAFRHALVREVAYDQVVRAERADKHRRAAAWLEGLAPGRAADRAELLAAQYRDAVAFARAASLRVPGLAGRARAALREAGDRAAAVGSWQAAAGWHAEALALCPAGHPDHGELLLRVGRDRCQAEGAGEAELTAAGAELAAAGRPVAAAEAEMLLAELAFLRGRGGQRAAHLERALALVADAPPSPAKAAVLRGGLMHLVVASRHGEARRLAAEVLAMAGDRRDLAADARGAIGLARVDAGDPGGLDDLRAAIAGFEALGTPGSLVWRLNLAHALAALGDLAGCSAALAEAAAGAERFGSLRRLRSVELQRVAERYWTGRWDEAVATVDALEAGAHGGERHYLEWECRLWRGRIRLARGDLAGAADDAERAHALARETADPQATGPATAFLARARLAGGRADLAARLADELLAGIGGSVLPPEVGADLGLVLAALGRPDGLDRPDVPPSAWLAAAADLAAGRAVEAAAAYARIGSRPDEAEARLAAARGLLAAGHQQRAAAELAAAAAFWRQVGAGARLAAGRWPSAGGR